MKTRFLLSLVAMSAFAPASKTPAAYVWAWGDNFYGQLNVPSNVTNPVGIAMGGIHGLALQPSGTVIAWGYDGLGQTDVPNDLTNAVAVAARADHSLALRANGTVTAWGARGQFAEGSSPSNLVDVVAVAAGANHNLALKADGTVFAWGYNAHGECNVPTDLTNAIAVSAGYGYSLALRANGIVAAWGYNGEGECNVPGDLTNAIAISSGYEHSLALRTDGTVVAWGDNTYGPCNVPADLTNAIAVFGGNRCSFAIRANGTVTAWGENATVPTGLSNLTTIATGGGGSPSTLALASDPQYKVTISFVSPLSQTVTAGSQAFFSVAAFGPPPLSYQWYFGTNAIEGATNRWLALTQVLTSQSGTYTVVVSNLNSFATSQPVTLSVLPALGIDMIPAIALIGDIGASYRIDYINATGPTNAWVALVTLTITNSPQYYCDLSAIGQPARYYRLVQVP